MGARFKDSLGFISMMGVEPEIQWVEEKIPPNNGGAEPKIQQRKPTKHGWVELQIRQAWRGKDPKNAISYYFQCFP